MEQDSEILLNMFPAEIWLKLFNKFVELNRPDDIENTINSSQFFHSLTENERSTLLYPKVLQVLLPKYENPNEKEYQEELRQLQPRKGYMFERKICSPEKAFILKMRQICKFWCVTVDHHYQQLNHHYEIKHDYYPFPQNEVPEMDDKKIWTGEQFTRDDYQNVHNFIKHYENSHSREGSFRNPLISRSVSISGQSEEVEYRPFWQASVAQVDCAFWKGIATILEKYGNYVWYCDIDIRDKFQSRVEYYRQMRQWLCFMPNLKVLKFTYQMRMGDQYPTSRVLNRLKLEIERNPLPKFRNLKILRTHMIPAPIFNELVKKSRGTLKTLEVFKNRCQVCYDIYSVEMPNLKKLSTQISTVDELEKIKETKVTWKPEKLYLNISTQVSLVNWTTIFQFHKTVWGDTLTNLVIDFSKVNRKAEIKELTKNLSSTEFKLDLPNVKRFKLIIRNRVSIDFILSMKETLEVFEFFNLYGRPRLLEDEEKEIMNYPQVIKIVGFEGRLYESNIWELFPKLASIQVQNEHHMPLHWKSIDNLYTRDKWQKRLGI